MVSSSSLLLRCGPTTFRYDNNGGGGGSAAAGGGAGTGDGNGNGNGIAPAIRGMPELGASLSSTAATRGSASVSLNASVASTPGGDGMIGTASPKKTFKLGERVVI